MRKYVRVLALNLTIAFTAVTGIGTVARADPPRASHDHWRNTSYPSHYVLYDNASRTWVETVDCRVLWRFTALSNEMNVLTLYDASREMTVRLTYEGMFLKPAGAADFSFYQPGTFDTRTLFEHRDANGTYSGTIIKRDACRWEERFPGGSGPAFTFTTGTATPQWVEIYDGSRDLTVRMDAGSMYLRFGQGATNFFKNGRWRG
jgi:hypothetical protein